MNDEDSFSWLSTNKRLDGQESNMIMDGGVMNVLAAVMYPRQATNNLNDTITKQLPLGIVMHGSDLVQEPARPKKRSRASKPGTTAESNDGSDDSSKKQRGRPRLEGRDESAVDRRRTQIRLAQRAYRNRKETTIATLKQKNEELHNSIVRLNQTFAQLYDDMLQAGIIHGHVALQNRIQSLRDDLAHAATLDVDNEEEDGAGSPEKSKKSSSKAQEQADQNKKGAFSNTSSASRSATASPSHPPSPSSLENIADNLFPESVQDLGLTQSDNNMWYFGLVPADPVQSTVLDMGTHGDWSSKSMDLERAFPVRSTYTYSFQETSFAQRLHRMCIERAFRNLANPGTDPSWIAHTFRLAMEHTTRSSIRYRFSLVLQRKAGESLEDLDMPYFHVGGAGTHFPRRDALGRPFYPPNLQNPIKAPGPWRLLDDEEGPPPPEAIQSLLDEIGFGGEWLDSHEVEEYLRRKGIHLDGSSSFTEADVSAISRQTSPTPPIGPSHASSRTLTSMNDMGAGDQDLGPGPVTNSQPNRSGAGAFGDFGTGYNWSTPNQPPLQRADVASPLGNTELVARRGFITIDVEKFMDRVITGGACLGRAPGFRRAAVDHALQLAVKEAFM